MYNHFEIARGRDGLCLLNIIENGKSYFLPLVEWPDIENDVRANFYGWLELAKQHTQRENALQALGDTLKTEGFI